KLAHLPIGEAGLKWGRIFGQNEIHRMAVAFRWGDASMEMRRDRNWQLVDLAYNNLAPTFCLNCWSRKDSVVAPDGSRKAGKNMSNSRFLRDLIVVGFRVTAYRLKHRRNRKRNVKGSDGRAGH